MEQKFTINLPSKGKQYPNNQSTISISTLVGDDEELLAELSKHNVANTFYRLLESKVDNFDVKQLTLGDELYLLLWLASNSYSNEYPVSYVCPECETRNESIVDLNKLEVISAPDSVNIPVTVDTSFGKVAVRLLTVGDEIEISKIKEKSQLYKWARTLITTSNRSLPTSITEVVEYLGKLPVSDLVAIREVQDKYYYGPKLESPYECPSCGFGGMLNVPFRPNILFRLV
jgi:hypothetical protein